MRQGTGWVIGGPHRTMVSTIRCPICLQAREVDRHLEATRPTCSAACHARWQQIIYAFVCQDALWGSWATYCARTEQIDEDIMLHRFGMLEGPVTPERQ